MTYHINFSPQPSHLAESLPNNLILCLFGHFDGHFEPLWEEYDTKYNLSPQIGQFLMSPNNFLKQADIHIDKKMWLSAKINGKVIYPSTSTLNTSPLIILLFHLLFLIIHPNREKIKARYPIMNGFPSGDLIWFSIFYQISIPSRIELTEKIYCNKNHIVDLSKLNACGWFGRGLSDHLWLRLRFRLHHCPPLYIYSTYIVHL